MGPPSTRSRRARVSRSSRPARSNWSERGEIGGQVVCRGQGVRVVGDEAIDAGDPGCPRRWRRRRRSHRAPAGRRPGYGRSRGFADDLRRVAPQQRGWMSALSSRASLVLTEPVQIQRQIGQRPERVVVILAEHRGHPVRGVPVAVAGQVELAEATQVVSQVVGGGQGIRSGRRRVAAGSGPGCPRRVRGRGPAGRRRTG